MCTLLPRSRPCQFFFQIAFNPIRQFAEDADPGRNQTGYDEGLNCGFKQ
jgi:hypothetical protein